MMLCCLHDGFNGTVGLSLSQVFLESISEDGQLAIGLEATEGFLGLMKLHTLSKGSFSPRCNQNRPPGKGQTCSNESSSAFMIESSRPLYPATTNPERAQDPIRRSRRVASCWQSSSPVFFKRLERKSPCSLISAGQRSLLIVCRPRSGASRATVVREPVPSNTLAQASATSGSKLVDHTSFV